MFARGNLGVVVQPDGGFYVPGWCSWLPFSSWNDACKLPTPAQVRANDRSNIGPAASAESRAQLEQWWQETEAAFRRQDPEVWNEYDFAMQYPNVSAAIGTGPAAQAAAAAFDNSALWWAAAGAAALVLLVLVRR